MNHILLSWGLWLLAIVVTFGVHEGWALATVGTGGTLTAFVRRNTLRYPILIFILGLLAGGAALHFWGRGLCG